MQECEGDLTGKIVKFSADRNTTHALAPLQVAAKREEKLRLHPTACLIPRQNVEIILFKLQH